MSSRTDRARLQLHSGRVELAISNAFNAGRVGVDGLSVRNLATALQAGGVEAVRPQIERAGDTATDRLRQTLPRLVRETMRQAARSEVPNLRQFRAAQDEFPDLTDPNDSADIGDVHDLDIEELGLFDINDPFLNERVNEIVNEELESLSSSMVEGLLLLLTLGVAAGVSTTALAQRLRAGLGLRPDQVRAVQRLAEELATARPGSLVVRFRARPGVRSRHGFAVRIPRGGASAAWIEEQLSRYIAMQRNARARLIGRTLAVTAWERGKGLLWLLALRSGLLPPGTLRRWVTAGDARVCPRCRRMEGAIAPIGEPFVSSDAGSIPGPPLHARCRCSAVLVRNRTLTSNEATKQSHQTIDRRTIMSRIQQVFRTAIGQVGEDATTAQWRAANERNNTECGCSGKSSTGKSTTTKPTPEQQERQRTLARLRNMSPAEERALYESIHRDWLAGFEPPDSYAAALVELRKEYETDRPTTYQEVE